MIDLNCRALTELCHAVLPGMLQMRDGAILNVASTAAFQAGPGMAVYYASKAYVLSFSEALHEEVRGQGVRVSALCPGPTATEFLRRAGNGKRVRAAQAGGRSRQGGARRAARAGGQPRDQGLGRDEHGDGAIGRASCRAGCCAAWSRGIQRGR